MTKLRRRTAVDPQITVEVDAPDTDSEQLAEEVLVEEVSIDGMCGVY
jgi:mycofactocin precursor